jgi:hypothetical protein
LRNGGRRQRSAASQTGDDSLLSTELDLSSSIDDMPIDPLNEEELYEEGSRGDLAQEEDAEQVTGTADWELAHAYAHSTAADASMHRSRTASDAVSLAAKATQNVPRILESIVERIADFCATPAVAETGQWDATIPLDSPALPDCSLNLSLSHFDLTLRFDTADARSKQLILQHETTLRRSLEQALQARFTTPRNIEVIVT